MTIDCLWHLQGFLLPDECLYSLHLTNSYPLCIIDKKSKKQYSNLFENTQDPSPLTEWDHVHSQPVFLVTHTTSFIPLFKHKLLKYVSKYVCMYVRVCVCMYMCICKQTATILLLACATESFTQALTRYYQHMTYKHVIRFSVISVI
jgi:hypothetical protein